MKIEVLDQSKENGWILGKVSLWSYLDSLSQENFDYDIQRGIVVNPYLDSILNSVIDKSVLPPFSLVSTELITNERFKTAELDSFSILDGLQRTYRLWLYKKISELAIELNSKNYQIVNNNLKVLFPDYTKIISPRQIRSLFDNNSRINVWNLKQRYEDYFIYLYIWQNLSEQQAVKKMLLLNAGQKRMPIAHQYELMYLHVFKDFQFQIEGISLYRSKDEKANDVKKGNRQIGEYVIPSIIIGLQSFIAGMPMRLSGDMLYSATAQEREFISESSTDLFFNRDFVLSFVRAFNLLDIKVCQNDYNAKVWMSKDATIAGLMGGFGAVVRESYPDDYNFATNGCDKLEELTRNIRGDKPFQLEAYNQEYNKLQSARINIGMILRKAIANYTRILLTKKDANWKDAFVLAQNKRKEEEWYD